MNIGWTNLASFHLTKHDLPCDSIHDKMEDLRYDDFPLLRNRPNTTPVFTFLWAPLVAKCPSTAETTDLAYRSRVLSEPAS